MFKIDNHPGGFMSRDAFWADLIESGIPYALFLAVLLLICSSLILRDFMKK